MRRRGYLIIIRHWLELFQELQLRHHWNDMVQMLSVLRDRPSPQHYILQRGQHENDRTVHLMHQLRILILLRG